MAIFIPKGSTLVIETDKSRNYATSIKKSEPTTQEKLTPEQEENLKIEHAKHGFIYHTGDKRTISVDQSGEKTVIVEDSQTQPAVPQPSQDLRTQTLSEYFFSKAGHQTPMILQHPTTQQPLRAPYADQAELFYAQVQKDGGEVIRDKYGRVMEVNVPTSKYDVSRAPEYATASLETQTGTMSPTKHTGGETIYTRKPDATREEIALHMAERHYERATPLQRAALHAHAAVSGKGVDYVVRGLIPGGKTTTDITKEKYAETFLHRDDKKYPAKVAVQSLYGSVPGLIGTSVVGGVAAGAAVKGIGGLVGKTSPAIATKSTEFLVRHSKAVNVAAIGVFGGLAVKEDYEYYKDLKRAGTPKKEIVEAVSTEVTKQGITFIGFASGFRHGVKKGLPLKFGDVKVPTAKGEMRLWRGVYVQEGRYAQPLIGRSMGKIRAGTPKIPEGLKISEGYVPISPIETKVITAPASLKKLGFKEIDVKKIETATDIMAITEKQPSKYITKEFIREVKTLNPKGVETVIKHTQANKKIVKEAYGSFTARPQMAPEFQRVSGDIDIQLIVGEEASIKFSKSLVSKLRKVGNKARLSKEHPTLIEVYGKDKKWHHAVDVHSFNAGELTLEGAYGFSFSQKAIKIEKIKAMRLSEHGLRKGAGSLTFQEGKIAPPEHRLKDIGDFYVTQDTLIRSMKKSPTGFLKRAKVKKGKELLKDWKEQHKDYDWDEYFKSGKVKVEILTPKKMSSPSISASLKSSGKISPLARSSMSPGMSPSKSLSMSPSMSPGMSPSKSPSMSPSMSPGMGPSMSPGVSPPMFPPLKLPSFGRSKQPVSDDFFQAKQSKAYKPTLTAVALKLKSKKKSKFGITSGLGLRPVII